jgi:hypothetical protein
MSKVNWTDVAREDAASLAKVLGKRSDDELKTIAAYMTRLDSSADSVVLTQPIMLFMQCCTISVIKQEMARRERIGLQ